MLELNFTPFPVLETERLILRNIAMSYEEDIFLLRSNIDAMKYIHRPLAKTIEDARALIDKMAGMTTNNEGIQWGISLKNDSRIIGTIGYHRTDKEHYRAEIGYMLDPAYWNKGISSEAASKVIDFGFNQMKVHSIEAKINPANIYSSRLLLKQNFVKEAYFKEDFFWNGEFLDTEVYSLLRH